MRGARLASTAWVVTALAGGATAQVSVPSPQMPSQTPMQMPPPTGTTYDAYGPGEPVELSELARGSGSLSHRMTVRTRGMLSPLGREGGYFELAEGLDRVVLIPVTEFGSSLQELRGRRVEVVGRVRPLVVDQGRCLNNMYPTSYCEDPILPPTPDLVGEKAQWPSVSITAWTVLDISPLEWGKRGGELSSLADLLETPPPVDRKVKVLGRFCGASLCGGLSGPPHPSAWVLQDGEAAIWIIGKPPQGRGWRLDPTYAGDTSRWIEVAGKLLPCGTGARRCLRAESLVLAPRPEPSP